MFISKMKIGLLFCLLVWVVNGDYVTNKSKELHRMLFADYQVSDRPQLSSGSVEIQLSFHLTTLIGVNELDGEMTSVGFLTSKWYDERLTWDASQFANITSVVLIASQIWIPCFVLANPTREVPDMQMDKAKVRVFSDGTVLFQPGDVFNTNCDIDIFKYPFDEQVCEFLFLLWPYKHQEVSFVLQNKKIMFHESAMTNGGWKVTGSRAYVSMTEGTDMAVFKLNLERKSEFFIVNILLPIITISFLGCLSFLIPHECGERLSFTVTVLLSFAVCITLVSDNIPKTSSPVALLSYYLFSVYLGVVLVMLQTTLHSRIHHLKEDKPVPPRIRRLFTCLQSISKKVTPKKQDMIILFDETKRGKKGFPDAEDCLKTEAELNIAASFSTDQMTLKWTDVARILDYAGFCFYLFYFLLLTTCIFMYMHT